MNLMESPPIDLPVSHEASRQQPARTHPVGVWLCAALLFAAGVFVRVVPSAGFSGAGFDEVLYRNYVIQLEHVGLGGYPAMCEHYLQDQRKPETMTKLPPTRFLYVLSGYLWKRAVFGDARASDVRSPDLAQKDPALIALRSVSCFFSILLLGLAGLCGRRMFGNLAAIGILALMAFAPLQIHMGQHALIDGFFAFWAMLCLWTLWENLRHPDSPGWLMAYACSLVLMVLTKENAFFVYVALWGLVMVNRWTRFGTTTPKLLLVMCAAPLMGVAILVALAGGVEPFIEIYRLLVSKAETLRYAIMTGDGPWYRYLVDLMIMSPIILCLALTGLFTSVRQSRELLYLTLFVAFSYLVMCNVKYGMNLRYATIWDLPLRAVAIAQIGVIGTFFERRRALVTVILVAALCAYELRQYVIFFKDFGLYELVTEGLVRAVKILK
jgi:Dolichyl-phosphate-mannose-protein mannosyltransferase